MTSQTDIETIHQKLDQKFASIADLESATKSRLPKFALDYLQGGIGSETGLARNRTALDKICLRPRHIVESYEPKLGTRLFGKAYAAPFGIAPLGLSGLIWPDAATLLARTAHKANIPFILSTVATTSLEDIAKTAPDNAWFQLYVPNDDKINKSLIERAKTAGYDVLVVTVDVPALGRRQHDIRNGLAVPPRISPTTIIQSAMAPAWAFQTVRHGMPQFHNLKQYVPENSDMRAAAGYVSSLSRGHVGPEKLQQVRDLWPGKLVIKGILNPVDAKMAKDIGCDGIIVSNHGARQLDAAPSPLDVLGDIRKTVGQKFPLIIDSGVRSGLDVARMLASGADFVLLGRGFAYGVAGGGQRGADHVNHILTAELKNVLSQLGCPTPATLSKSLV